MVSQKVSLYWNCKKSNGWKRYPAAIGRNGKVRPGYAQVGNAQMTYPDGHYELRHTENRRTIWTNVGSYASIAQAALQHHSRTLRAEAAAREAGTEIVQAPDRVELEKRADDF